MKFPSVAAKTKSLWASFLRWNKSLLVIALVAERSSRWLFQDCEVVHFNGGRVINLREERKEKRR